MKPQLMVGASPAPAVPVAPEAGLNDAPLLDAY
jgi:hypothetical protein